MTDEFKQYIAALANYCRNETFHGEYSLRCVFKEDPSPGDDEFSSTSMDIKMDTVYLWFRINIYPNVFEFYTDQNYKGIGECMLHELCHIFLEPVVKLFLWDVPASQKPFTKDTIERQTQRIANTMFVLLPKNWYTPDSLRAKGLINDNSEKPGGIAATDADSGAGCNR